MDFTHGVLMMFLYCTQLKVLILSSVSKRSSYVIVLFYGGCVTFVIAFIKQFHHNSSWVFPPFLSFKLTLTSFAVCLRHPVQLIFRELTSSLYTASDL